MVTVAFAKFWALVQFRTGPKPDGKHTVAHTRHRAVHAPGSSALFHQSSARCETALAPNFALKT